MKIGFEEILGLFFLIFFVVIPLFAKKNKPPAKGVPQSPGPRPGSPGVGGTTAGSAAGSAGRAVADTQGQPGSWREILQEVQRRVQAAEGTEAAASGHGPVVGGPTSAPRAAAGHMPEARTDGRLVQGQASASFPSNAASPSAQPPVGTGGLVGGDPFGRGLASGQTTATGLGRVGTGFVPPVEAEPARVTRLRSKGRAASGALAAVAALSSAGTQPSDQKPAAKLGAPVVESQPFIRMGKDDLVRGMIWHEILSEPAAVRRFRRTR